MCAYSAKKCTHGKTYEADRTLCGSMLLALETDTLGGPTDTPKGQSKEGNRFLKSPDTPSCMPGLGEPWP